MSALDWTLIGLIVLAVAQDAYHGRLGGESNDPNP